MLITNPFISFAVAAAATVVVDWPLSSLCHRHRNRNHRAIVGVLKQEEGKRAIPIISIS